MTVSCTYESTCIEAHLDNPVLNWVLRQPPFNIGGSLKHISSFTFWDLNICLGLNSIHAL